MNALLQKAEAAYKAKIDPRLLPVVMKIVSAGKQVMYSPQTRHMMQAQLAGGADPEKIGQGIAKLMGILFHASKKTAPMQALIPAGMLLLFEGLQFLEDAGTVQVTPDLLAACTQATSSALLQVLGIKPEQVQGAIDHARTRAQPAQPAAPGAAVAPAATPGAAAAPAAGIVGSAMGGA
jgi:peptidoglycan hydrolase-like protein with peptidoglycan-binding domain